MDTNISRMLAGAFSMKDFRIIGDQKTCAMCGSETGYVLKNEVLLPTTKEKDLFPNAEVFCLPCTFTIRCELFRKFNYIVQGEGRRLRWDSLSHSEVWEYLLKPIEKKMNDGGIKLPYFISLTSSHKKSNVFYGNINYTNSNQRSVVYEQKEIIYDIEKDKIYFDSVYELYNKYNQNKDAIKTGDYFVSKLPETEYNEIMELEENIKQIRGQDLLNLIVDYVQKGEMQ